MIKIELYPHQVEALKITKNNDRVAYYLDMGLGKTFVGSEKLKEYNNPFNLLVCQKSKIEDWVEHFKTYYNYEIIVYKKSLNKIPPNSIIIINYELLWRREELKTLNNFTLMLDESSYIKNDKSNRSKFILNMKPNNVILLSGTPTGGKYEELYSQLKLLGWKITKKLYWNNYIKFISMDIGGFKVPKVTGYKNIDRLKKKLADHGAVFMKTEEVMTLPDQVEQVVKIKNTKEYKQFKKDRLITIDNIELVGDTSLTKMLYMRQLASQYNKNKLDKLKELLVGTEGRVIIFYNFTKEMELIKDLCNKLDKPVSVVNGETKNLDNYKKYDNSITLVQYQAGAMGLNLQLSNKIIYYSLPLASELFEQSKKRTHRIGQKRTCMYWYLITTGTIENSIFETLKERMNYTNKLFEKELL